MSDRTDLAIDRDGTHHRSKRGPNWKGIEVRTKRQDAGSAGVIWVMVILCMALLASTSSFAQGSSGSTKTAKDDGMVIVFDPFALRSITVTGEPVGGRTQSAAGLVRDNPRRPIRIPFRLPVRSPCRPGLDGKTAAG